MFSLLGKVLVLLIVSTSIFCLMGGVAVYTQKMDYATPRGEAGKKTLNRVDEARAKVKNLLAANQRAITRLSLEMEPLVDLEGDILQRRDYYHAQMDLMTTGKWYGKVDVADPIQEISYGVETKLAGDIDDTATSMKVASSAGFPPTPFDVKIKDEQIRVTNVIRSTWTVVRGANNSRAESHGEGDKVISNAEIVRIHTDKEKAPTQPAIKVFGRGAETAARPATEYVAEIQKINTDIDNKIKETRALIAKHAADTVIINGNAMVKGLRTRIDEQKQIRKDAEAETAFLEDYVSRRQAEAELFVKRRDAMADRLAELKKFFNIQDVPAPMNP
jgi:hypothetical protein